jgi:ABC-2 type transport system ATP-binding protein
VSSSTPSAPAIQTFNLTKTYGTSRGIRNVNLEIARGEIFGFLGPNGAGKSTTLRTLLGFLRPTSGRAEILGLDVAHHPVETHRYVGNLPSEFSLEDRMTGWELLRFYAAVRGSGERSLLHASALAERLDANLETPMRRLSRGNKQKIGIIQALFHEPPVIVLDEPTSGLDPLMQEQFLAILREARTAGQTIFFSSHILSEVEAIADRVGIIRSGELVEVADPQELTSRAWREVRIRSESPVDAGTAKAFAALPGVEELHHDGAQLSFTVHGPMGDVIRLAASLPVAIFDAEPPPLEEIFLHYYGKESR